MYVCWSVKGGSGTSVVAWATEGGGAGRIGELFDTVLSGVLDRANSVPIEGE